MFIKFNKFKWPHKIRIPRKETEKYEVVGSQCSVGKTVYSNLSIFNRFI